jgi:hypothetical protein
LTLNRRPALELALPQIELNPGTPSDRPEPTDFDLASPFDVPAFLRRQS